MVTLLRSKHQQLAQFPAIGRQQFTELLTDRSFIGIILADQARIVANQMSRSIEEQMHAL